MKRQALLLAMVMAVPLGARAAPETTLFISPMGEPFRATLDQPYPSVAWFARADANHDGSLTREEFVADAVRFFDSLETSGEGYLDEEDISRYETEVAPEIKRTMRDGGLFADALGSGDVGGGHHNAASGGDRGNGRGGERTGMEGIRGGDHDRPTGTINASTRRDDRPEGGAIYSVLPFPEPVTSARAFYGQRITRAVFAAAAEKRFDMLTGRPTTLKLADLPRTPIQDMTQRRR